MRIGFDFDNTIISYDALFHKVACELGVIHPTLPINKLAVREFLRAQNKEETWTQMQGYVYGARIGEAQVFADVLAVLKRLRKKGHHLAIISHKTQYPYLGQQYDLHQAARVWINTQLLQNDEPLIEENQIFFETSKENKLARIADFNCDVFVDDLPEILLAENFPKTTQRFLFDPENHYYETYLSNNIVTVSSWKALENHLI